MEKKQWQQQLAGAITDFDALCAALELDSTLLSNAGLAMQQFPLRVPHPFLSRIEKQNPNDPLLRQILPLGIEMHPIPGYVKDPLSELKVSPVPGVLHKYPGRVLLTLTGVCAIHCRYCFRRHYPYIKNVPGVSEWQPALSYITEDPSIEEVILSGGDPLILKDETLSQFVKQLETIPYLKRLRIHTRLPIVIPDRITEELVRLLEDSRLKVILVLHSNHPNELDNAVHAALKKCHNMTLLNQAVLLKDINDSEQVLISLSERLFEMDTLFYYLHLLDPVMGAAHFEVSEKKATDLIEAMCNQLPGYMVPKLAREVPDKKSKQWVQ